MTSKEVRRLLVELSYAGYNEQPDYTWQCRDNELAFDDGWECRQKILNAKLAKMLKDLEDK